MIDVSLWLDTEGGPPVHHSCGARATVEELGARYEKARVARPIVGECCGANEDPPADRFPCSFDLADDDDVRRDRILGEALCRAEGRTPGPFTPCPRWVTE